MDRKMKLKVLEAPDVREVYSDALVSAHFNGNALILTLGIGRPSGGESVDPHAEVQPVVAVNNRVVLSTPTAIELMKAISKLFRDASSARAAALPPATPEVGGQDAVRQ